MDAKEDEDFGGVTEVTTTDINPPTPEIGGAGYETLAQGHLSPRHRRLALLAAQGKSNADIAAELGYSDSRVSILLKNPYVSAEVHTLQERIYEETVGARIKTFAEPALNVLHQALTDRTNKVKMSEKIDVAKWVIEKIDGKAAQKIEAGENMLAALMDRLDASKTARVVNITNNFGDRSVVEAAQDVSPVTKELSSPKTEEDLLADWVTEFDESR